MALAGIPQIAQSAEALGNLALITPKTNFGYQPFDALSGDMTGPSWLFHYEGENKVKLEAETTDNWLEDNTSVQDHTVVKPEIITVRGYIGEVVSIMPPILALAQQALMVLAPISAFSPSLSASAQIALNQSNQAFTDANNVANSAISAWNSLTGNSGPNEVTASGEIQSPNQNNQQAMFSKIYGYWRNQVNQDSPNLFQVQTPWAVFDECSLIGCEATQNEDTEMMTEFVLTFKMVRIVNENSTPLTSAGRAATLSSPQVNNGTITLSPGPTVASQLSSILGSTSL